MLRIYRERNCHLKYRLFFFSEDDLLIMFMDNSNQIEKLHALQITDET